MKFAIRDDDLNYFFTPDQIEKDMSGIWDICPVSMSVIPYVVGDWRNNVKLLEAVGSANLTNDHLSIIQNDHNLYPIAENSDLVEYVRSKVASGHIYLTLHGVHHRNMDGALPKLKNNFSIGAEFYTERDLKASVVEACTYLESVFGQKILVFTPPQNIMSLRGMKSVFESGLSICGYMPSVKRYHDFISIFGVTTYIKYFINKVKTKNIYSPYPVVIKSAAGDLIEHKSLQPSTKLHELCRAFDLVYKQQGNFVLSTHSYGFEHMTVDGCTMKETLLLFLQYVSDFKNVDFVSLDKVFEQ